MFPLAPHHHRLWLGHHHLAPCLLLKEWKMKSASTHPIVADVSGERNLHLQVGVGSAEHEEKEEGVVELGVEDAEEEHANSAEEYAQVVLLL